MNFCAETVKLNDGVLGLGSGQSEKNQHIGCPALYGQFDILDVLIVSRIIGSAQRNIVEIVGPST